MKVLIFCPTYRLEPETVDAIFELDLPFPVDILFTRDNPTGNGVDDLLHNYQKGRRAALDGGYDAMLTIESDMIPPRDTLKLLVAVDADVALGLYLFRHGPPFVVNALRKEGMDGPGQSLTLFPGELQSVWKQGQFESGGAGLGCAFIHRHVLDQVDFRPGNGGHCDWHFTADCLRAGFRHVVDFGVICGHKRPDGVILWPTIDGYEATQGIASTYDMEIV